MQIIPLSEGSFTIDKSKIFVPFDLEKDELQQRHSGSLLVEVQPFDMIERNSNDTPWSYKNLTILPNFLPSVFPYSVLAVYL